MRAVGLFFGASADICVVFWGSFSTWPCKVPCFLGPIATRVCSGAVKHVLPATLGGRSAVFSRSDCDSGRGWCPGNLQEAPVVVGCRPEAAGRVAFDPAGKIRVFRGPGAPKHSKFAYKSGGPEGGSGGPNVRVPVGKPTFPFSRFGRGVAFGVRIRWICTSFSVYFDMRSGHPKSITSGPEGSAGRTRWIS